ncbi:hypothetical protein BD289DRAFT_254992 [Coniella lustricola]|uniref:Uncharacterized protein n=1 Tax=Coniella lustricola TaxID=2025994 RepID=A0A2T3AKL7_9PEZI|nr:hypothetical protein BD289DRAFT_254992 [Coniella lustricola]
MTPKSRHQGQFAQFLLGRIYTTSSLMMIIAYPFNEMYSPSHSPALELPCVVMTSSGVFPPGLLFGFRVLGFCGPFWDMGFLGPARTAELTGFLTRNLDCISFYSNFC